MKTIVKNVLDKNEESLFVNNYSAKHNLISYVICKKSQVSKILDQNFRCKIESELNIVEKTSLNGDSIAFCTKTDLIARQTKF